MDVEEVSLLARVRTRRSLPLRWRTFLIDWWHGEATRRRKSGFVACPNDGSHSKIAPEMASLVQARRELDAALECQPSLGALWRVYVINVLELAEPAVYVGQTARSIGERLEEHRTPGHVRQGKPFKVEWGGSWDRSWSRTCPTSRGFIRAKPRLQRKHGRPKFCDDVEPRCSGGIEVIRIRACEGAVALFEAKTVRSGLVHCSDRQCELLGSTAQPFKADLRRKSWGPVPRHFPTDLSAVSKRRRSSRCQASIFEPVDRSAWVAFPHVSGDRPGTPGADRSRTGTTSQRGRCPRYLVLRQGRASAGQGVPWTVLIELLQNAADAWRAVHGERETCDLTVVIDESPALVVANRGAPFPVETVLRSLGQIGNSSKKAGEAIGHKGIGFKSVLEVSATPEVYSGFTDGIPGLSVRLDPYRALDVIRAETREWDSWVETEDEFASDPLQAVPALRYSSWVAEPPAIVTELGRQGYDTVVRLPFSPATGGKDQWIDRITHALADVSDQILVPLGLFDRIHIEDLCTGRSDDIVVKSEPGLKPSGGVSHDEVVVLRNGEATSRWLCYRKGGAEEGDLASETMVAIRVDVDDVRRPVPAHVDGDTSSPFHLFFPTRIGSGLPFLLHGYFEVDASRTGFFQGSAEQNEGILERLADLVVGTVDDLAARQALELAGLAELVTTTPPPEAPPVPRPGARRSR